MFTVLDNVLELWNKFTGCDSHDLISVDLNQILGIKLQKSCEYVRAYGRIIYSGGP